MRRWIAIAVVAPWVAWAVARTLGLDRVHPFIAFAAFTPYAAATAPLAVVLALALRRWVTALVALAALALLALAVLPRAFGDPATGAADVTVMAINVYGGGADPERILELARRHDVDVLTVEELTPEALSELNQAGARDRFPHRAAEPRTGGGLGNGVFSRHPIERVPDWSTPNEPAVDVDHPALQRPLRVRVVHPMPPINAEQTRAWRDYLGKLPDAPDTPAVIAGDFNATLDHRDFRQVLGRGWEDAGDVAGGGLQPTWPTGRRIGLTIDHVLVAEGSRLSVTGYRVEPVRGTDHRAVIAELRAGPAS